MCQVIAASVFGWSSSGSYEAKAPRKKTAPREHKGKAGSEYRGVSRTAAKKESYEAICLQLQLSVGTYDLEADAALAHDRAIKIFRPAGYTEFCFDGGL